MAKSWPIVFLGNQLLCFIDSEMANQWIIMVPANQLGFDNLWHIK